MIGRSFGGTAICDYFAIMKEDAASLHPAAVVLEFSGNRFTTCMHHPDGSGMGDGDAYMKYVADVQEAVQIFTSLGTYVSLAGAPVSRPVPGTFQRGRALNVMYSWVTLVSAPGMVTYIDAGTAVQNGTDYTDQLPCLPEEPCPNAGGSIVVRSYDGVHLCPGDDTHRDPVTKRCLVWSSGAYRYGRAMAAPVIAQLSTDSSGREAQLGIESVARRLPHLFAVRERSASMPFAAPPPSPKPTYLSLKRHRQDSNLRPRIRWPHA